MPDSSSWLRFGRPGVGLLPAIASRYVFMDYVDGFAVTDVASLRTASMLTMP
jgi:hypothetical protein